MGEHNYRGAERVYGWSFYSQGTKETGQASADGFFNDAIQWFGHEGDIPKTQHEKGRLLAEIISRQKTLLILDGLEPLQYPPGEMHGFLKDKTMPGLLKNLARTMNGLCIITSRCRVEDVQATEGTSSRTYELEHLSYQAGMAVLKSYDLKGRDREFIQTSQEFKGHALALHLVGGYLKAFHKGDIKQRNEIPKLTEEENKGGHARRVMESYENWFAESNQPELAVLHLLGLFDRPAAKDAIALLRAAPAIPGLTDRLQHISKRDWQGALNHLRDLRLLAEKDDHDPDTLDCHPLIREYFGDRLEKQHPTAWKEAHARLYDYYKDLPEKLYGKELPDTLEEMEPLFAAVMHGCLAGKHQEALDDVYWKKILRENELYINHKLGASGADLSCLSGFFETLWDRPASGLKDNDKAAILSWAGFALRAVGRLSEAVQPMKAGMKAAEDDNYWKGAALNASNLSELYLTLGDVASAEQYGTQCVTLADHSGYGFEMESGRTTHADALHQAGKNMAAEKLFIEAEQMQEKRQPEYPFLYAMRGFQFCDLLLSQGKYQDVLERARATLKWAFENNASLLTFSLEKLSISKAFMLQDLESDPSDPSTSLRTGCTEAADCLNQAVDGLREAGAQHHVPRGLFARATLYRHLQDFTKSWIDLDEARAIAGYGQMRLHLTDYHLEAALVIQAQVEHGSPNNEFAIIEDSIEKTVSKEEMDRLFKQHVALAGELIKETGYYRRDGELEALRVNQVFG